MCPTSYRWIQVDSSGFHWIPLEYLHKFGREKTNIQVDSSGFQVQFPFIEYSSWIPCHSFWTFFQWIPEDSSGLLKKFSNLYLILYQIFSAKSDIELFCIFNQINTHELNIIQIKNLSQAFLEYFAFFSLTSKFQNIIQIYLSILNEWLYFWFFLYMVIISIYSNI